jgi:hypothetical protein
MVVKQLHREPGVPANIIFFFFLIIETLLIATNQGKRITKGGKKEGTAIQHKQTR